MFKNIISFFNGRKVTITLNGRKKTVAARAYSSADLIYMLFEDSAIKPMVYPEVMSITYDKGPKGNREGSLAKGQSLTLTNGMILNIHRTDNS